MSSNRKFGPDDLIVNFHDACVYGRDLLVLRSKDWLNADCIHYQLKRLQQDYCSNHETLIFDPSAVSLFMHQCQDEEELKDFASGYDKFQTTKRLLIPISDDMVPSSHWNIPGRGTHWSLLVLILGKQAYHFDSIPDSGNTAAACAVAQKFFRLLESLGLIHIPSVSIRECPCPKQKNGYDCGLHLLLAAEVLVRGDCEETQVGKRLNELFEANPDACTDLRRSIAADVVTQAATQAT